MGEYLHENASVPSKPLNELTAWLPSTSNDCPVIPSGGTWETVSDPTRFQKKFPFSNQQELTAFVVEVMAYQNNVQHHGRITIEHDSVMIEVYTHDVNTITEVDQEYIHEVDNILLDVQYSGLIKDEGF